MTLSDIESQLGNIWKDVLDLDEVNPEDNFFDLGGDSILATRLSTCVKKRWELDLNIGLIFEAPTLRGMASLIEGEVEPTWPASVAPLQPRGKRTPFLCVDAGPFFLRLVQRLDPDQPFFGLRLNSTDGLPTHFSLEDIAKHHVQSIRRIQPSGPYCLGGWSSGGLVAYEVAQQLRAEGEEISLLVLFDTTNSTGLREYRGFEGVRRQAAILSWRVRDFVSNLAKTPPSSRMPYLRAVAKERVLNLRRAIWSVNDRIQGRFSKQLAIAPREPSKAVFVASNRYYPKPYDGPVILFRSAVQYCGPYQDPDLGWQGLIKNLHICHMPGGHEDMFLQPHVELLAEQLQRRLLATSPQRVARRQSYGDRGLNSSLHTSTA